MSIILCTKFRGIGVMNWILNMHWILGIFACQVPLKIIFVYLKMKGTFLKEEIDLLSKNPILIKGLVECLE